MYKQLSRNSTGNAPTLAQALGRFPGGLEQARAARCNTGAHMLLLITPAAAAAITTTTTTVRHDVNARRAHTDSIVSVASVFAASGFARLQTHETPMPPMRKVLRV